MAKARLVAPHFTIVMDDGAELEVQAINWDLLQCEREARKRQWPGASEAPMEWTVFTAWHAMRREGVIPKDMTPDEFAVKAVSIETRSGATDPTPPDREDG